MLDKKDKRKYAQGIQKLKAGYMGYDARQIVGLHLTTREGDDQSTDRFRKDIKKLFGWYRKIFEGVEYAGCLQYSPGKGLLHWHGMMRAEDKLWRFEYSVEEKKIVPVLAISRRELGDKWNEIHGAFAVDITVVYGEYGLTNYVAKHLLREVHKGNQGKLVVSKGWVRPGYRDVEKAIARYLAGEHSRMMLGRSDWQAVRLGLESWCRGDTVLFKSREKQIMINKGRILTNEGILY